MLEFYIIEIKKKKKLNKSFGINFYNFNSIKHLEKKTI